MTLVKAKTVVFTIGFIPLLSILYFYLFSVKNRSIFTGVSSVYCNHDNRLNKICHFTNVCYNGSSKNFLFFFDTSSVIVGIQNFIEFQNVQLSSVHDHNKFFANITFSNYDTNMPKTIITKAIALARFKPDNIMHVIHDDLLPLFLTYQHICKMSWPNCRKDYHLFFVDDNGNSPYSFMYKYFSDKSFIYSRALLGEIICFEEVHLGLTLEGIWYQYGFKKPRGFINSEHFNFDSVSRFRKFILSHITTYPTDKYALFLYRPFSRKIENVQFVIYALNRYYKGAVKYIPVTLNNTKELIELVANANVLVGIHGAEMILSIFLNPNARVIELFPYGVSSDSVSFLKPLAVFPNCPFLYFFWENKNATATTPPNLNKAIAKKFKDGQIPTIKEVYCCDNPDFLFLMYQNTYVGSDFEKVAKLAMTTTSKNFTEGITAWIYPGRVLQPECYFQNSGILLRWFPPEGSFISKLKYLVTLKYDLNTQTYISYKCTLLVRTNAKEISIWITAIIEENNRLGQDTYLHCVH